MDDIQIETELPIDQFDQWKAFIQDLFSHPATYSSHFLTLKSYDFTVLDSAVRATIDFNESGQLLAQWLQLQLTSGREMPVEELVNLLEELLSRCAAAQKDLYGLKVTPRMIYVLVGKEIRIAPFPVEGEEGRGLRDVLRMLSSLKHRSRTTFFLDKFTEKVDESDYQQVYDLFTSTKSLLTNSISLRSKRMERIHKALRCGVCHNLLPLDPEWFLDDGSPCCSASCYHRRNDLEPGEILTDFTVPMCLGCGQQSTGHPLCLYLCEKHCICRFQCFREILIDEDRRMLLGCFCPSCMEYEAKLDKTNTHRPLYEKIEELKGQFMRRETDSLVELVALLEQYRVSCLHGLEEGQSWPLCVQPRDLSYSVLLLACCQCKQNTLVPKWRPSLMPLWPEAPFLLQCQWKVHAVCSQACFLQIASLCPVCPGAALVSRGRSTLEIVRRIPAIECKHNGFHEETLPYMHCSHESCKECLFANLDSRHIDTYECQVCYTEVNKETVMKELFS